MDHDPIAELNQSLKAAGIHPSQLGPVVLDPDGGDIYPHVPYPEPGGGRCWHPRRDHQAEFEAWVNSEPRGFWFKLWVRLGFIRPFGY